MLLVPLTSPGDTVEVEIPSKGSRARLVRVISPGPDRVTPLCHHFGECGGCDLMHLSYRAQMLAKLDLVVDTMRRIAGKVELPGLAIIPNPAPFNSRIRATWHPAAMGTAGYFRRGTHDVVPIQHCPILDPALERVRSALSISRPTSGLTNGLQTSLGGGEEAAADVVFTVAGEQIRASAHVFFQASLSLFDRFVGQVVHQAARSHPDRVLELYAGIGLFTIPLARRVGLIETVESSEISVSYAHTNVRRAGLSNVRIHEATVERWLLNRHFDFAPDVVVVDPPRVGLSADVAAGLVRIGPRRIVYVSCDPATFARDSRKLVEAGYRVVDWTAFDLFPQTHHVELVARFERIGH